MLASARGKTRQVGRRVGLFRAMGVPVAWMRRRSGAWPYWVPALILLWSATRGQAAEYIWPLSRSTTPDEMHTSFGPRMNYSHWDFHEGIDLPAVKGTKIHAVRGGTVYRAREADSVYSSRHVVLRAIDPSGEPLYIVYLHLNSIASGIAEGVAVAQGDLLGTVGDDHATYSHLHLEIRKGSIWQVHAVHPLRYLPYRDTPNFTAPIPNEARFNTLGSQLAGRLLFGAPNRNEGDLVRVEVDLFAGDSLLQTRRVDFEDETTIVYGSNDDRDMWTNDIAVEGYQTSNMTADGRMDLRYGVLVRALPASCDRLVARVVDLGGTIAASTSCTVPRQAAVDEVLEFEDGSVPPPGWIKSVASGCSVSAKSAAACSGSLGLRCVDGSSGTSSQRACIEYALPGGRIQWMAEGWFNPRSLSLPVDANLNLFYFMSGSNMSAAARLRNEAGSLVPGLSAKKPDGSFGGTGSSERLATGVWRRWQLKLLRLGTRETTAVLSLDAGDLVAEVVRYSWDGTLYEPNRIRIGMGLSPARFTGTVDGDGIRLTDTE